MLLVSLDESVVEVGHQEGGVVSLSHRLGHLQEDKSLGLVKEGFEAVEETDSLHCPSFHHRALDALICTPSLPSPILLWQHQNLTFSHRNSNCQRHLDFPVHFETGKIPYLYV